MKELTLEECAALLDGLFGTAVDRNAYETVCAILRVASHEDAQWDPLEESVRAFADLNWVLEEVKRQKSEDCQVRIALLIYCQAVEMTAVHEILVSLVRIIAGKPYKISPFRDLARKNKKSLFSRPPSAKRKFNEIKQLAEQADKPDLSEMIDLFLNDQVRNAFSHSDYVLTQGHFRWTEGESPHQIAREELLLLINNCFMFIGAFLEAQPRWRHWLGRLKRYHKWPRYEVFEILASEDLGVHGFAVHFSNGSKASYVRKPGEGSKPLNLRPRQDGTLDFFVGDLEALEKCWKINGKRIVDWEEMNNPPAATSE